MSAAELPLPQVRHWVFDMDGTLTVAAHDFARIRRELGMPADADILQQLANCPPAQAQAARAWLWQHEHALARTAQPAPGALALVHALHAGGCRLGILTRNTRALAQLTLAAIGLDECFAEAEIIGRDELPAKPDPAGLHYFAERWQVAPGSMCMVGDHYYDLACAQAAGVPSVLVNLADDPWLQLRGWRLPDCQALLAQWQGGDPAGTWPDCR